MNLFTRIVCLVLLITALIFVAFNIEVKSQPYSDFDSAISKAESISGDKFKVVMVTPKGVRIYAVDRPSVSLLNAIDTGFTQLFAAAKGKEYKFKKKLKYSDYVVFVSKADREEVKNGSYSPDLAIGAAQYAGTKYDKGGYIYAAGIVVSFHPNAFMIAHHTKDFDRVSRVVRYETEHLVLFHNDYQLFKETADHSKGGGHPIMKN